jgi:hypothetical protein
MPPDVRDWLTEDHLAWFVIDEVAVMDLDAFYVAYRLDGRSRPAYDPAMMVALLLYAYARGTRSSRQIERACEEDVAFRILAAQQRPDHATIARFVSRHQDRLRAATVPAAAAPAEKVTPQSAVRGGGSLHRVTRQPLAEAGATWEVDGAHGRLLSRVRRRRRPLPDGSRSAGATAPRDDSNVGAHERLAPALSRGRAPAVAETRRTTPSRLATGC